MFWLGDNNFKLLAFKHVTIFASKFSINFVNKGYNLAVGHAGDWTANGKSQTWWQNTLQITIAFFQTERKISELKKLNKKLSITAVNKSLLKIWKSVKQQMQTMNSNTPQNEISENFK